MPHLSLLLYLIGPCLALIPKLCHWMGLLLQKREHFYNSWKTIKVLFNWFIFVFYVHKRLQTKDNSTQMLPFNPLTYGKHIIIGNK